METLHDFNTSQAMAPANAGEENQRKSIEGSSMPLNDASNDQNGQETRFWRSRSSSLRNDGSFKGGHEKEDALPSYRDVSRAAREQERSANK